MWALVLAWVDLPGGQTARSAANPVHGLWRRPTAAPGAGREKKLYHRARDIQKSLSPLL